jgi:hypothetical protein
MAAADAMCRGAWINGMVTIAGGAVGAAGVVARGAGDAGSAEWLKVAGDVIPGVGNLVQTYAAEAPQQRHEAKAQRIGRSIEQANVEADKLAQQARRAEKRSDTALDHANAMVQAENQRATGVLSKF